MGSIGNDWSSEPIAIIGLSCKFAGDASNPEKLWKLLKGGRSAWTDIPSSRFNRIGSYHPNHAQLSTTHVQGGHFIDEDIGLFDAAFFNYSAETASTLDPQFRLQLESVYEALENSGLPLDQVAGSNTSVFAGIFFHDYKESMFRDEDNLPRFMATGTGSAMHSNRISHFFDLRGASMTLDTGCSTTLIALHQAVQSLRTGEADMSIVGGSNVLLNPDMFKMMGSLGFLSPDGKSFAFDSRANGYGRGEGVATIVIKRLKDAVAAGDPIRAVIRETLLNQDGKSETITSPSLAAQEALIRDCYRKARADPLDTQYFEAHGTGTQTGDPIEARAIASIFQPGRPVDKFLRIGSVKTNIGHTEPTSGLASIIKVALALENRRIPPSINFEKPNEKLTLDDWRLKVVTELEHWPAGPGGICRASVNNFGYGGSNAHVIMEDVESWLSRVAIEKGTNGVNGDSHGPITVNGLSGAHVNGHLLPKYKTKVLVLSARDEQSCQRMVSNLKEFLHQHQPADAEKFLQSLAYTLGQRRTLFPWVAAHTVPFTQGIDEVVKALDSPKFKPSRTTRRPRIGMVFTGQGAQWYAMGRELIIAYPVFKRSLEEADGYVKELGAEWSLVEELCREADTTRINETAVSTPICIAVQISLVRLLSAWGVAPSAITSHSSGEIAAAYVVRAISYRQAIGIAYYRSILAADKNLHGPIKGGMVAIGLDQDGAERYLGRLTGSGKAVTACVNSPASVTMAGDLSAVQEIEALAKADGVFARLLKVDTGYHSHHMSAVARPYLKALRAMPAEGLSNDVLDSIAYSSPVTGSRVMSAGEIANPEHWVESLIKPVQFLDAFTDMVLGDFDPSGSSIDVVVEVGPHTALGGPIQQILQLPEFNGIQLPYYGCLVRNTNARDSMQALAANLLREGHPLNMEAVNFPWGRASHVHVLTNLPSYPWNHQVKHWFEPRFNRALRERTLVPHDLLGSLVLGTNPDAPSWRNILRSAESPWIRDHVVQNNILYPAAGFVCLALEAITQIMTIKAEAGNNNKEIEGYRLRDVDILQALVVPDNTDGIEIQTSLRPVSDKAVSLKGWKQFEVCSVTADNRWTQHAKGLISVEFAGSPDAGPLKLNRKQTKITGYTRHIDPNDMFASLRSVGINHGPIFRNMKSIVQSGKEQRSVSTFVITDTSIPNDLPRHPIIHPTTLDSVVQAAFTPLPGVGARQDSPRLPRSIDKMWVSRRISHEAGHTFEAYSTLVRADAQSIQADISLVNDGDEDSESEVPVLEIQGLHCQSLGRSASQGSAKSWEKELCSKMEWAPDVTIAAPAALESIKKQLTHSIDPEESSTAMDLRRVCIYFIQNALATLTVSDVDQLDVHHAKFYKWMQNQVQLASACLLGPRSTDWLLDSTSERQLRIDEASKSSVNGELVCLLGKHLVAILRRQIAPLDLMKEDQLLDKFSGKALKAERSFAQIAKLLRYIVHKNPRARILEIGAGTGIATRYFLNELGTSESGGPLAASYQFTDVSSDFFEAARSEFAPWSNVLTFDKLDIAQDPASQGFSIGSYDIVIACEALNATKPLAHALGNVRSLIKTGGQLLLLEITQDQLDVQYIFGLLPEWWPSEEPQRTSSPSLSVPVWDQVLKNAGFSGVDVDIRDCESDDVYALSTILSTVPPIQLPKLASDGVIIVTSSNSPPDSAWLVSLQRSIAAGGPLPGVHSLESAEAAVYSDKICIFVGELTQPILYNLEDVTLKRIKAIITSCKGLVWVTCGGAFSCEIPELGLASGFLRSLRNEYVGRPYLTLDLDPNAPLWRQGSVLAIVQVLNAGFGNSKDAYVAEAPIDDFEYAERDGVIFVPRCYKDMDRNKIASQQPADDGNPGAVPTGPFHQADRPLCLHVGIPGLLDTLAFGDDPWATTHGDYLPPEFIEIEPRAYGVNFRDVMVAMGQLNERVMGLECAGIITRVGSRAASHGYAVGDHVFSMLRGPFGSRAHIEWTSAMHMPAGLSFEDAASMPVIFATAWISLVDIAHLERGESILIHAAAGGVGQAAIMMAKYLGAEIFATVSTPDKRELIMQKYGIPADHIFSSRDKSFAPGILAATGGCGVHVVLNSLAGPLLQESFNLLAPFGHFVEIGKRDLEQNSNLEMLPFSRQVSFTAFYLLEMSRTKGRQVHRALTEVARLIENKVIAPIHPVTVYPLADVSKAFRLLQAGKHTGKVVLSVSPQEQVPVLPRTPCAKLSPHASYLLVGGVGGIGRSIAHWMVAHGARNLIILSRSAGDGAKTGSFVAELQEMGCRVKPISCDVSNAADLAKALSACKELLPIRGVIQAAMVLRDSILEQMTIADYQAAILPKVNATWNLHTHFASPNSLDFFVILSSIAGIIGNASQSNYSAGGAYEDALARLRVSHGLPAVSIDLGAVKTIGYIAETGGVAARMQRLGFTLMNEDEVLGVLESAILAPYDPQVVVGINTGPGPQWGRDGESQVGRDARFQALQYQQPQQQASGAKDSQNTGSLANKLADATSQVEAETLVRDAITQKLADIFMIPIEEIDTAKHPSQYGVDSLVAVELRNMLALQAAAEVSIFGIMQSPSLGALASDVAAKSGHVDSSIFVS